MTGYEQWEATTLAKQKEAEIQRELKNRELVKQAEAAKEKKP